MYISSGLTIGCESQTLDLKQTRHITYDVTFRRVRVTTVAVGKQ